MKTSFFLIFLFFSASAFALPPENCVESTATGALTCGMLSTKTIVMLVASGVVALAATGGLSYYVLRLLSK